MLILKTAKTADSDEKRQRKMRKNVAAYDPENTGKSADVKAKLHIFKIHLKPIIIILQNLIRSIHQINSS